MDERDSPVRAAAFVEELFDACMQLGEMPMAFPVLTDAPKSGIRKRVYGEYLIFYLVTARVDVVNVIHGRRNHSAILFPQ